MSDPAIKAGREVWERIPHSDAPFDPENDHEAIKLVSAARAALKPIQQLWRRELGANNGATFNERARNIFNGLAPLIFNDEEMEGGSGE